MKLGYLEMLHAEFEVSILNSMAVREIIRLDFKQIRKIRTSTGSVQSWPKGYFLLLLRLVLKNCPAAEELRNHL